MFQLMIDHSKPLQFIFNNQKSKHVLSIEYWALRLQSFKFCVPYRSDTRNISYPFSKIVNNIGNSPLIATVVGDSYVGSVAHELLLVALN